MLARFRLLLLVLLLSLPQLAWSETQFVSPQQVDLARLLPPPPAMDSAEQRDEIALLLQLQKDRTPDMVAFAQADAAREVFRFTDVVGPQFTAEKLPVAAAFFKAVKENGDAILGNAKKHWDRPRPYAASSQIDPCVPKPGNASYPSGHSTYGTLMGIILANMVPEKAQALAARAEQYRFNREIGGVHYPSDVAAGRITGTVIAAFLFNSPEFQQQYAAARAEVRSALGLAQ
ncbi:acid phosphatase [Solidesulfovibrio magneticus]|nr:phosphatase PAP2 family protein [Solidesulfovibrio magneticus]